MISKILFNKNLPFPHISLSLFLSSLIISIPVLINEVLYAFLAANVGLAYPWQYLTSVFAHGPEPPLLIHLLINLLIVIFCVVLTEKLLGTWRTFVIIVFISILVTTIRFETYNFNNGVSYFIFAYAPFAFIIFIQQFKNYRNQFPGNTYNILGLLTLFTIFIFYPIYFSTIDSFFCERNILHLISIIFGMIFLLIWRKRFTNNLKEVIRETIQKKNSNIWDRISRIVGYLITGINLLALMVLLIFFY